MFNDNSIDSKTNEDISMSDSILNTSITEASKVETKVPTENNQNSSNVSENRNSQSPEKTIVISGPLSTIYTKALQVALSKDQNVSIVNETNAVDAAYILKQQKEDEAKKDVPLFVKVEKDVENSTEVTEPGTVIPNATNETKPLYVYVTNDENLSDKGLSDTFNDLRIALSKEDYSKVILCMDDGKKLTKRQLILEEYVEKEPNGKTVYSQSGLINYLV